MSVSIDLLANNGVVGGGEVMMVALARAMNDLGVHVRVIAPGDPSGTAEFSVGHGLGVVEIPSSDRRTYLTNLAMKRRLLTSDLWWCNGLVPALATALSRHRRVVHLHQEPSGEQRWAWQLARQGVHRVVVPSRSMQDRIAGSTALSNWTDDLAIDTSRSHELGDELRLGFIGRFSTIKGLDVLARAVQRLDGRLPLPVRLVLAGDDRFVSADDSARVEADLGGVANLERLGWVPRETFFEAVDLVVAPSVWAEPFGLVAAEAMASGVPVVVSDAGALPEVVGAAHPWIVRSSDEDDLARVIEAFVGCSAAERGEVVRAARARWEAEFSPMAGRARVEAALVEMGVLERGSDSRYVP